MNKNPLKNRLRATPGSGRVSEYGLAYFTPAPDLTEIPSEVSVPFKNFLKRDSITKAKALEDIAKYIREASKRKDGEDGADIPDSVLSAWIEFYPRASLDNSRRVRELAHVILSELTTYTQDRMKKRMAHIIGPWLAGSFDRDKVVARVATRGFELIASTEEKRKQIWEKAQPRIMDYALSAIKQRSEELSDQQFTTNEDMDAKYYRVVASSISLVTRLIQTTDWINIREQLTVYLEEEALWRMVSADDSHVRRLFYSLLGACLNADSEILRRHLRKHRKRLVEDALRGNQSASAPDLLKELTRLTKLFPELWGEKESPYQLLMPFIEKGSQGSSREYWMELRNLLLALPGQPPSPEQSAKFLKVMRKGITRREEPVTNSSHAWSCYLSVAVKLVLGFSPDTAFLQEHFYPLTTHFILLSTESSERLEAQPKDLSRSWVALSSHPDPIVRTAVHDEWESLTSSFLLKLESSLPAVSKDYQTSQKQVEKVGGRWFDLASAILALSREQKNDSLTADMVSSCLKVLNVARDVLIRRNFKPFGAASIFQSASAKCPDLLADGKLLLSVIPFGDSTALEALVTSPSLRYILICLEQLGATRPGEFERVWNELIVTAVELQDMTAVASLVISPPAKGPARRQKVLQDYLGSAMESCAQGKDDAEFSWRLVEWVIKAGFLDDTSLKRLAEVITNILLKAQDPKPALRAVTLLAAYRPQLLSQDIDLQTQLTTGMLAVLDRQPEEGVENAVKVPEPNPPIIPVVVTAEETVKMKEALEKHWPAGIVKEKRKQTSHEMVKYIREVLDAQSRSARTQVMQGIIQKNLTEASALSLDIRTIVHEYVILSDHSAQVTTVASTLKIWNRELRHYLEVSDPDPSLALESRLGNAYFLVQNDKRHVFPSSPGRDSVGRSIPVRIALFISKVLSSFHELAELPRQLTTEILYLLGVTMELALDQLMTAKNGLWSHIGDRESEAEELIRDVWEIIKGIGHSLEDSQWKEADLDDDSLLPRLVRLTVCEIQSGSLSPLAFYSAKFLSSILEYFTFLSGPPPTKHEAWFQRLAVMRAVPEITLATMAFLAGFNFTLGNSPSVARLCRELASIIVVSQPDDPATLRQMVLFNACLSVYDSDKLPLQNRNQVLVARHIASWMVVPKEISTSETTASPDTTTTPVKLGVGISAEALKAVLNMLPNIKGHYGDFWKQVISFCLYLWNTKVAEDPRNQSLSYLQASIKLWMGLESAEDACEDILDTLKEHRGEKWGALLGLLKLPRDPEMLKLSPYRTFDDLLSRAVKDMPLEHVVEALEDLYPLVASESRAIQTTAVQLLRPAALATQQELAVELLLEKDRKDATLPRGLLDLLTTPPTFDAYHENLDQFPNPVRSYLLAWQLVFDSYSKAPHKLRDDYTDYIKKHAILEPLLDFMFDVLGHSGEAALNLDKEGLTSEHIRAYDIKNAEHENAEKDMHWLLVHLCYLTLTYLSGAFRTWYLERSSRQMKTAIETWIKKFFSPLLIAESLDQVAKWNLEQEETEEDEQRLDIQIYRSAREVLAKYDIDDESAGITITVPAGYPLETVVVETWKRVAIDEKKWHGWLAAIQGIITFANGSIADGLTAFRANIVGALKGQTECAICYSIVATDKKLPDKRCGTCKNLFHGMCLYKWIQNSGRNTCPLCRNAINLLGDKHRK